MGTCIDCHDKVNNGEKPWKEVSYSLPPDPKKSEATDKEAQKQRTQQIILQAIGKQITNVKISMKCVTCHKKVRVPASHKIVDWDQNHGSTAFYQLEKCLNCHQDSKWIKDIPKDDIVSLFIMDRTEIKDNTFAGLVNQTRNNPFCGTCHNYEPPSHAKGGVWIKGHAYASIHDEDKWKCYVCHDKEKRNFTVVKESAVIACFDCHKHGFSGILDDKAGY
jgi:cytochrome c-type protein NapC